MFQVTLLIQQAYSSGGIMLTVLKEMERSRGIVFTIDQYTTHYHQCHQQLLPDTSSQLT